MHAWKKRILWGLPIAVAAAYAAILLTNGDLPTFFAHQAWGSRMYANVWQHMLQGNMMIDPQFAVGEYFVAAPDRLVVYFGVMPVIWHALASLLFINTYVINVTNLSMVLAAMLAVGSIWYAVRLLAGGVRHIQLLGASVVAALLFASPFSYLLVWSWTYHEVIIWALAWAFVFVATYSLWLFAPARKNRWWGVWLGLAVGMAMLCRPSLGLAIAVPYAALCGFAIWRRWRDKQDVDWRLLWPGVIVCSVLAITVMAVNYGRWSSPFTFVRLEQNIQLVELFPERRAAIQHTGEFNLARLPTAALYYFVPTGDNFQKTFPFITPDRTLDNFNHTVHFDYIEGSRLPITLSMPYLLLLAALGAVGLWRMRSQRTLALWLLAGGVIAAIALGSVYALSLRYSVEFLPSVLFLALLYLAALKKKVIPKPGRYSAIALVIVGICSLYIGAVTMLAYKEFVWDVPPAVRSELRQTLRYQPTPAETKHIINGQRFPVY